MAKQDIKTLKERFTDGKEPTGSDFGDVFDSYRHKDEKVGGVDDVTGLRYELDKKVERYEIENLQAGILFQDTEVETVLDLVAVANPKNLWAVYVRSEEVYYQYTEADNKWSRTPFSTQPKETKRLLDHLLTSLGGSETEDIKVRYINKSYPLWGIIIDERFCIATETFDQLYIGKWSNSGDELADADKFIDNCLKFSYDDRYVKDVVYALGHTGQGVAVYHFVNENPILTGIRLINEDYGLRNYAIAFDADAENLLIGIWGGSGDDETDAQYFYDNAMRLNNAIDVRLPLEGGEVGDLLTKGEGGANKWLAGSILDTVRGLEGVRYVESGEPLSVIVFDRGGSDSAIGFSDDEGALLYGTWNSTGDDEADAHDFFYNSATWIHASDLRGIANKADKLKVVELEQKLKDLQNIINQLNNGDSFTVEGGSTIDLPGNVLDAVTDVKIVGKTDGAKSVTTPMRVRSVGANLFDIDKYKNIGEYTIHDGYPYRSMAIVAKPNTDYYMNVRRLNNWSGTDRNYILISEYPNRSSSNFASIAHTTRPDNNTANGKITSNDAGEIYIIANASQNDLSFALLNSEISITPYKIDGDNLLEFEESNLYIKTKAELESVGATSDFIKDGKLHKNVESGVVLAKPYVENIHTSGQVVAHPNGSIYFEPIVSLIRKYEGGIAVDADLPLKKLDSISTIDYATGVETAIDISKAVITGNSFTHPELKYGDIVQFEYYYDDSPIYGLNETEHYNSNVVLEDNDKAGDFYRVVNKVKSGVLKQELIKIE